MAKKKPILKLNARHQAFVDEYLINGNNGTKAYQSAYPDANSDSARTNAAKLLTNTNISGLIKTQQAELATTAKVSREYLTEKLLSIVEDVNGVRGHQMVSIKAIEVLAKMSGLNEPDKLQVEHKGIVVQIVKPLEESDE